MRNERAKKRPDNKKTLCGMFIKSLYFIFPSIYGFGPKFIISSHTGQHEPQEMGGRKKTRGGKSQNAEVSVNMLFFLLLAQTG